VKLDVEARVRQGVKAVLEEVLQEKVTQHLEGRLPGTHPTRRGERDAVRAWAKPPRRLVVACGCPHQGKEVG
jgi:hypothetical protein